MNFHSRFAYLAAVAGDLDRSCTEPMRFFANPIGPAQLLLREGKFRGFSPACQARARFILLPRYDSGNSTGFRLLAQFTEVILCVLSDGVKYAGNHSACQAAAISLCYSLVQAPKRMGLTAKAPKRQNAKNKNSPCAPYNKTIIMYKNIHNL